MVCRCNLVFTLLAMLANSPLCTGKEPMLEYPATVRQDVTDTYHGVEVADPYRWLEDDPRNSQEVAEWITAQNELTRQILDRIEQRDKIHERLTELWDFERYSIPSQTAGKYFYEKNDGLQNQAVLYVADNYSDSGRVLLDPNQWAEDGTIALGFSKVSEDGRYLSYGRKEAGSDWSTVYVLEIDTGKHLSDTLEWTRWGNIVWNADSTGFYYVRYPEPAEGEQHQALATNPACYFHQLGTSQQDDKLVYRRPDHPTWSFWLERSDDDRWLILSLSRSTDPQNQVWIRPADAPLDAEFTPLVDDFKNQFWFVGNDEDKIYFFTDFDAPTKRVIAMQADQPGREHITEVIPASEATLDDVTLLKDQFVAHYLQDVVSQVKLFNTDGSPAGEVELPGIGSAHGFGGRQQDTETFFLFTSYTTPASIYRYDLTTGQSELVRQPEVDFDPDRYESRQAFYTSKDGTRIPIIVSHRQGLSLDGQRPTLLYGYGGFGISITPSFSVAYATWMEMGGVVAVPNLRGGGEYGESWHKAGKTLNKQNVFDDFIAAAEWLIDEGYTSRQKLAIMGGSNGGLLVGAVMTQRPELFGACLPSVGVLDMLRYHQFTAGHFWRAEYGTVDDPEQFQALLSYSPYHNVERHTCYPPTLIFTADTDDRVVPMHSFKFGAALQHVQSCAKPVLLRIETRAGHGAGTPTTKRIDEVADRWAFLWKYLEMANQATEQPAAK